MIEILSYRPLSKGNLTGFLTIKIPKWGNFIIKDISLFEKNGGRWLNFPAKLFETNGEKKYNFYCSFEDQNTKILFEREVYKALDEYKIRNKPQTTNDINFIDQNFNF